MVLRMRRGPPHYPGCRPLHAALPTSLVVVMLFLCISFGTFGATETVTLASAPAAFQRSWVTSMLTSPNSKWMITMRSPSDDQSHHVTGGQPTPPEWFPLSAPNWSAAILVDTISAEGYRSATLEFPSNASSSSLTVSRMMCEEYTHVGGVTTSESEEENEAFGKPPHGQEELRGSKRRGQWERVTGRCSFSLAVNGRAVEPEPFFGYRVKNDSGSLETEVTATDASRRPCPRGKHCTDTSLNVYKRVEGEDEGENEIRRRRGKRETQPVGELRVVELSKLKVSGLSHLFYAALSFTPSSSSSSEQEGERSLVQQFFPSEIYLYGDIEQYPGAWEKERVYLVKLQTSSELWDFFLVPGSIVMSIYVMLRLASWWVRKGKQQQQQQQQQQQKKTQ